MFIQIDDCLFSNLRFTVKGFLATATATVTTAEVFMSTATVSAVDEQFVCCRILLESAH